MTAKSPEGHPSFTAQDNMFLTVRITYHEEIELILYLPLSKTRNNKDKLQRT